jgi:hypothetical protein
VRVRFVLFLIAGTLASAGLRGDVRECVCDLTRPETAASEMCRLCVAADKQPRYEIVFAIKDPVRATQWLALPRGKFEGANPLLKMSETERIALWSLAIQKATELWGTNWAVAMNGAMTETECHASVHIGRFLTEKENERGAYIDGIEDLPVNFDARGLWFHPVGGRLHVHTGEEDADRVLAK